MSRTRIPANGRVGESAAAVARPLQSKHFKSLSTGRDLNFFARPKDVLDVAIVHPTKMFGWRKWKLEENARHVVQTTGPRVADAEIFRISH